MNDGTNEGNKGRKGGMKRKKERRKEIYNETLKKDNKCNEGRKEMRT